MTGIFTGVLLYAILPFFTTKFWTVETSLIVLFIARITLELYVSKMPNGCNFKF